MAEHDLKTQEGRTAAISEIENSFLEALSEVGVMVSERATCIINNGQIELGVIGEGNDAVSGYKMAFGCEVTIQAKVTNGPYGSRENEIRYGTSGSFIPSNIASYWRTIHAASILLHWDAVCKVVNTHCTWFRETEKEILKDNNL